MSRTQRRAVARAENDASASAMFLSSAHQGVASDGSFGRPTQRPHRVIGRFFLSIALGAIALLATALDARENGHE